MLNVPVESNVHVARLKATGLPVLQLPLAEVRRLGRFQRLLGVQVAATAGAGRESAVDGVLGQPTGQLGLRAAQQLPIQPR